MDKKDFVKASQTPTTDQRREGETSRSRVLGERSTRIDRCRMIEEELKGRSLRNGNRAESTEMPV